MNPIPGQATMTAYAYETYKDWVDQDLAAGAWTVMMIHAIEGSKLVSTHPQEDLLGLLGLPGEESEVLFGWRPLAKWEPIGGPNKLGRTGVHALVHRRDTVLLAKLMHRLG